MQTAVPAVLPAVLACRYDPKEKRYVLMWASGLIDATSADSSATIDADPKKAFPLFIAVSANRNPLGESLTVHPA